MSWVYEGNNQWVIEPRLIIPFKMFQCIMKHLIIKINLNHLKAQTIHIGESFNYSLGLVRGHMEHVDEFVGLYLSSSWAYILGYFIFAYSLNPNIDI